MLSSPSSVSDQTATAGTLDIVLVNWNTGTLLRECLQSINEVRMPQRWSIGEIVVVDNASTDDSIAQLPFEGVPLRVIRNPDNKGFAAACNQGAEGSHADLLLFLNPDTRLFVDSLAGPIHQLIQGKADGVGIVGIQLVDEHGDIARTCSRLPRPSHFLCQALGLNRLWPRHSQAMTEWDHRETRDVDQVIGAFFMMSRSLYEQLGGFDERFFVYFEEVDLSARAARAGWRSRFLADSRAYHLGGGSSRKVLDRRLMYSLRSRLLYAGKHFSRGGLALTWIVTLMLEPPVRFVHAWITSGFEGAAATWRGYALLLKSLLSARKM